MSTRVEDHDRGYDALVRRFEALRRVAVLVGIFEREGSQPHADDAVTVIEVATIHEFGSAGIPERSFLRAWFDENTERAREALRRLLVQVTEGKLSPEQALERFGQWIQGEIQKRIARGIPPPLAESTIKKKGSSTPLVDKGQLRSSITYKIERS